MEKLAYGSDDVVKSIVIESNILDPDTRRNYSIVNNGTVRRPRVYKSEGRFCIAFLMEGSKNLCYRVWKQLIPDSIKRYETIGRYLAGRRLPYFANFRYIESALRVESENAILPGIAMDWINGKTLDEFLKEDWPNLTLTKRASFIHGFYNMCLDMRENGIAHGDLSCQNILVTPGGEIRLVDYDSVYVSSMGNSYTQPTFGLGSFQHPLRTFSQTSLRSSIDDDNFSQLVIALSLWVAFSNPGVTKKFGEWNLLFTSEDLKNGTPSERLANLRGSEGWRLATSAATLHPHVLTLMKALESIQGPLASVPALTSLVDRDVIRSERFYQHLHPTKMIWKAPYCTNCGYKFTDNQFAFCTQCGTKRLEIR